LAMAGVGASTAPSRPLTPLGFSPCTDSLPRRPPLDIEHRSVEKTSSKDWRSLIVTMSPVHPARVRVLSEGGSEGSGPVVYWMSRDIRAQDNWALLHAAHEASVAGAPLVVAFCIVRDFPNAHARQMGFLLRHLRTVVASLESSGISVAVLEADDPSTALPSLVSSLDARRLVIDMSPLRIGREWRAAVAQAVSCGMDEVDAHNIVPVWHASPKLEVGARTLRGKLAKLYGEFLVPFPRMPESLVALDEAQRSRMPPAAEWDRLIEYALFTGYTVPELPWAIPGEEAAHAVLGDFLSNRIHLYTKRNDPNVPQALSGLSPYLHFGAISAQTCALEARRRGDDPAIDAFFEEIVVRRELADNFCWYSPQYDTLGGQKYDWARDTLAAHAADPRPYIYTYEQLEGGQTHDELWNAAQREMVYGGKMHGFMRMYWAKKILEWTASPEQALSWTNTLNDKWSIDGRDPAGYTGAMWSIAGVHDQVHPPHQPPTPRTFHPPPWYPLSLPLP